MTDQNQEQKSSQGETGSDELKALREQNKSLLNEKKAAVSKAKELETRVAELEPLKGQLSKLAEVIGLDPTKVDPDKVRQEREAAARAQETRAARIRDEITYGLLESGRKLDKRVAQAIVRGAIEDAGVTLDETGMVSGAQEYIASWLATLGQTSDGQAQVDKGRVPMKPAAQPKTGKFETLKSFDDLMDLGQVAVAECYETDRATYDKLIKIRRQPNVVKISAMR